MKRFKASQNKPWTAVIKNDRHLQLRSPGTSTASRLYNSPNKCHPREAIRAPNSLSQAVIVALYQPDYGSATKGTQAELTHPNSS